LTKAFKFPRQDTEVKGEQKRIKFNRGALEAAQEADVTIAKAAGL